jgi:stage V sporulation protein B
MMLIPKQLAGAMDDIEAAASISALAPSVVLVCLMSAYRGYTQGLSNMIPTSVSQIIEVLCKLIFGLVLAWWLLSSGYGLPNASAAR